ncbi:hypothetical protein EOD39_19650 [Acipenser ruthenus]|uniref:Uncharacterized protein n=1 Tax=Acipenser ruthenus TaxID=7906 RepID=A0A444UXM0_ACIRT|nr:hypothetical protein EOD39_19650 [Acipenser ruthenus]
MVSTGCSTGKESYSTEEKVILHPLLLKKHVAPENNVFRFFSSKEKNEKIHTLLQQQGERRAGEFSDCHYRDSSSHGSTISSAATYA